MILKEDLQLRKKKVAKILRDKGIDAILVSSDVNCYYLTGKIFGGFCYVTSDGDLLLFSRYGDMFSDMDTVKIRKAEEIPDLLINQKYRYPENLSLDEESTGAIEWLRLKSAFSKSNIVTRQNVLRTARQIKTPLELQYIRSAAKQQISAYGKIKEHYFENMTDIQLSVKIEGELRLLGHLGPFRTFGGHIDAFMGTVLAGENGYAPSPYDLALGGRGQSSALPVGATGEVIKKGTSVLVDLSGNFNGYLSDISRTFSIGRLPEKAYFAHSVAIEIQNNVKEMMAEGVLCSDIWRKVKDIVNKNYLDDCFMGLSKKAQFVGHGLGLEINEPPVLTERDNSPLSENMVIASEPKFAIEGVGAVGVEDTFIVGKEKGELITDFPHEITDLLER